MLWTQEGHLSEHDGDKSDIQLLVEVTKDHFDTIAKGANLLLIAHGAGLAGCTAFFKDLSSTSLYGGLGLYVFIFGTGFMAAISGYGTTAVVRMNAVGVLVGTPLLTPRFARFGYWAGLWLL